MRKMSFIKAGLIVGIVMAVAEPAMMPQLTLAQTDVRRGDRRADRHQGRQAVYRQDRPTRIQQRKKVVEKGEANLR